MHNLGRPARPGLPEAFLISALKVSHPGNTPSVTGIGDSWSPGKMIQDVIKLSKHYYKQVQSYTKNVWLVFDREEMEF